MKRYGLIGHPLGHSFSKAYFTEKFEREGLDCEYLNFDLPSLDGETSSGLLLRGTELREVTKQSNGFNVTSPYKESILPYLDELDETAKEIGAVNTVKVLPDGRLKGYNTDVIGFAMSLRGAKRHGNALVLGTGGASKAVQYVLKKSNIPFHLVSRDPSKGHFTYKTLSPEIIKEHQLIINATPVGMAPHINEVPLIPYEAITPEHVLFDLIYNPEETLFLRNGKAHGASTINGLSMLHAQAEASWEIWNQEENNIFR